jgi:membrane-associated HD superfamily phosphohydrolase
MVSITPKNETASANNNKKHKQFNRKKQAGIMSVIFLVAVLMVGVLVLDAYEYISVKVAKDARTTVYATIKEVDPAIIEQQIGMKILSLEE